MAIGDLLWACPLCGSVGSIGRDGRGVSSCSSCATTYRRGRGASLIASRPGQDPVTRTAAEWVRALPSLEATLDGAAAEANERLREDRVQATIAGPDEPVRREGEVLGFRETGGETLTGTLRLDASALRFVADGGETYRWDLERLTAIQSSSRVVQIKQRDRPVVTFRFLSGSPRLWEALLQHAVQALYRRRGRGEIREFQPRIVVR